MTAATWWRWITVAWIVAAAIFAVGEEWLAVGAAAGAVGAAGAAEYWAARAERFT